MAKIVIVYLCWLFGGLFGLHHFYLGRDKHAFVWMMSFGGFGLGMFRDLWRLPEYLREFNRDLGFLNEFAARRARYKDGPPFSVTRNAGQLMIGGLLANLFRFCIPEFVFKAMGINGNILSIFLHVIGSAVGVHLVANIGHQKVDMKWCILGSVLGVPWMLHDIQSLMAPILGAGLASKKAQWDTSKLPPKGVCKCIKRAFALSLCGMIYMSLWTSVIYFNKSVPTKDGEYVTMYEAVQKFFKSPAWKEMKKTMIDVYNLCNEKGWGHCYQLFLGNIDPTGKIHAYKILEFEESNPSQEKIQSQCRKMARKYHPDKFKKEEEKKEALEKFIEVQKACDILNGLRKRRQEKYKKSESTTKKENTSFNDKDSDSKSTNENSRKSKDSRKPKDESFRQNKKQTEKVKILEFEESNPSQEKIQSQCRKMARKYHPDKFKKEEEKKEAQEKFIEVQKACDILNGLRKRRKEKNKKSESTTKRENTSFNDKDSDSKSTNKNSRKSKDSRKPKDESFRQNKKQTEKVKVTDKQKEHLKEKIKEKSDMIKKQYTGGHIVFALSVGLIVCSFVCWFAKNFNIFI